MNTVKTEKGGGETMHENIINGLRWLEMAEYGKAARLFGDVPLNDKDFSNAAILRVVSFVAADGGVRSVHHESVPGYWKKLNALSKNENETVSRRAYLMMYALRNNNYFRHADSSPLSPTLDEVGAAVRSFKIIESDRELFSYVGVKFK